MPIFEYVCQECSRRFETLIRNHRKAECPHCHSTRLEQQLSVFAVAGSSKSSEDFNAGAESDAGGACGACGDPRGPGACALED